MLLTLFVVLLAATWLGLTLAAFCPLRARRLRRELEEGGEC